MLGEPNFIAEQNEQYPGFARAHRTTGWTRRSLTSGIGRDRVQFT